MTGANRNILEAIGGTPIVKLQKVARHVAAEIFVKCDYLNPGGSMKDRVARNIVEDAAGMSSSDGRGRGSHADA